MFWEHKLDRNLNKFISLWLQCIIIVFHKSMPHLDLIASQLSELRSLIPPSLWSLNGTVYLFLKATSSRLVFYMDPSARERT